MTLKEILCKRTESDVSDDDDDVDDDVDDVTGGRWVETPDGNVEFQQVNDSSPFHRYKQPTTVHQYQVR